MLDSPCLDQTLDDSNLDKLEDHLEVKDLTLGPPMSIYCQISFHWVCSSPLSSPFRDFGLHFHHSDHSRWSLHSYSNIFVRPLTCVSNFAYAHISSAWAESFDKLKRALSCIAFVHFISAPLRKAPLPISNYLHFCEKCAPLFDKLLQALGGFDTSSSS